MVVCPFPLSIAPMMERTDRHYRYFMRQLTRRTLLYTEMVVCAALLHGDRDRLLGFDAIEHPIALQLGGDDPATLAACARLAAEWGYDEVNLNVGCPSDRVRDGQFGACLMAQPERVAACVAAMREAVAIPVTVKHRIGIDDRDAYEDMADFVRIVAAAGCDRFSVHARKAWLQGLSPKENRQVPPLRYGDVYRLKAEFPHLAIEINGGITTLAEARACLEQGVDAVMIGRAAYDRPYLFSAVDQGWFGEPTPPRSRHGAVEAMYPYVEAWLSRGGRLNQIARHLLNLFTDCPGSRAWKRHITERATQPGAGVEVLQEALALVPTLTEV